MGYTLAEPRMGECCVPVPGFGRRASQLSVCWGEGSPSFAALFTCRDKKDTFLEFSIFRKQNYFASCGHGSDFLLLSPAVLLSLHLFCLPVY